MNTKILHAINFFRSPNSSFNDTVQFKTLQSINKALLVNQCLGGTNVSVACVGDAEDLEYTRARAASAGLHDYCEITTNYTQMPVKDSAGAHRLPLLTDILLPIRDSIRAHQYSHIIFSNSDICLSPYFYFTVQALIDRLSDGASFVINRETISKELAFRPVDAAYGAIGEPHVGHDCFVIPNRVLEKIVLAHHIVGVGYVMRPLILNLILFSSSFTELSRSWLTFHYGDDMVWKKDSWDSLLCSNKENMINVYNSLRDYVPEAWLARQSLINHYFTPSILKAND